MTAHLVRYRTLTHTNVGWCSAVILRPEQPAASTVVVVSDVDGHLGPKVRPAARMVAASVHRELIAPGEAWELVIVEFNGTLTAVEFEQAFDGWYGRPHYRPLRDAEARALTKAVIVR